MKNLVNFFKEVKLLQNHMGSEANSYNPETSKVDDWNLIPEKEKIPSLLETLKTFNVIHSKMKDFYMGSESLGKGNIGSTLGRISDFLNQTNIKFHNSPSCIDGINVCTYEILLYAIRIFRNLVKHNDLKEDCKDAFEEFCQEIRQLEHRLYENLRDKSIWQSCRFEVAMQWFLVLKEMKNSKSSIVSKKKGPHGNGSCPEEEIYYKLMGFTICENFVFQDLASSVSEHAHPNLRNHRVDKLVTEHIKFLYHKKKK